HRYSLISHKLLGFRDGVLTKVENAGSQHCISAAFNYAISQMLQVAHTTGSNHRHINRIADSLVQLQIKTDLGTITVHAGQQDFTSAITDHAFGPFNRIQTSRLAATVSKNLPAIRLAFCTDFFGINGHNNTLRTKTLGGLTYKFRIKNRCSIDGNLVRARIQHGTDIFQRTDTTAYSQRNKYL